MEFLRVGVQLSNGTSGNTVQPKWTETASGKSKMAASKLHIPIYLLVHKIAIQFRMLFIRFLDPAKLSGTSGSADQQGKKMSFDKLQFKSNHLGV